MSGLAAPIATGGLMAFIASYVDTVGFIALFSLFTAHVTGNFVVIAATLVGGGQGVSTKLLAIPVFIGAVVFTQVVTLLMSADCRRSAVALVLAQAGLLVVFMSLGLFATPLRSPDAPLAMAAGLSGVFAMGLQNALARTPLFTVISPSTVMTGNVTQVAMDLVSLALVAPAGRPVLRSRLARTGPSIIAFALGAAAAAVAFSGLGFWSLIAPILLLLLVAGLVSTPT